MFRLISIVALFALPVLGASDLFGDRGSKDELTSAVQPLSDFLAQLTQTLSPTTKVSIFSLIFSGMTAPKSKKAVFQVVDSKMRAQFLGVEFVSHPDLRVLSLVRSNSQDRIKQALGLGSYVYSVSCPDFQTNYCAALQKEAAINRQKIKARRSQLIQPAANTTTMGSLASSLNNMVSKATQTIIGSITSIGSKAGSVAGFQLPNNNRSTPKDSDESIQKTDQKPRRQNAGGNSTNVAQLNSTVMAVGGGMELRQPNPSWTNTREGGQTETIQPSRPTKPMRPKIKTTPDPSGSEKKTKSSTSGTTVQPVKGSRQSKTQGGITVAPNESGSSGFSSKNSIDTSQRENIVSPKSTSKNDRKKSSPTRGSPTQTSSGHSSSQASGRSKMNSKETNSNPFENFPAVNSFEDGNETWGDSSSSSLDFPNFPSKNPGKNSSSFSSTSFTTAPPATHHQNSNSKSNNHKRSYKPLNDSDLDSDLDSVFGLDSTFQTLLESAPVTINAVNASTSKSSLQFAAPGQHISSRLTTKVPPHSGHHHHKGRATTSE
jgi:hypothetical protein